MYLLYFLQNEDRTDIGVFDTIENGRNFAKRIPGYEHKMERFEEIEYEYETINPVELPDYIEIEYNGNIIPITKFMFHDDSEVEIIWLPIYNLDQAGDGMIEDVTTVDAYQVYNEELREYIRTREDKYRLFKDILEERNYEIKRDFRGSEDGEAILYKKSDDDWSFLIHLDPIFVEQLPNNKQELSLYIDALLNGE